MISLQSAETVGSWKLADDGWLFTVYGWSYVGRGYSFVVRRPSSVVHKNTYHTPNSHIWTFNACTSERLKD